MRKAKSTRRRANPRLDAKSRRLGHEKVNARSRKTTSLATRIIEAYIAANAAAGARGKLSKNVRGKKASRKKLGVMTKVTIKMGDKLYLVTRRDIAPGYQAVQSCHAIRQFTAEHPEVDTEWFTKSNYLALLSVENESELMRLLVAAGDLGLKWSAFREPDVGGAITAIAIEPHSKASELCKALPLALQEV